jgi:hypothetical protein
MLKPDSLRAAIALALPALEKEPERLQVFIDKGSIASTGAQPTDAVPVAFEYRYRLNLLLLDFADNPDLLFTTILQWAAVNQRQLLDRYVAGDRDTLKFEADILDAGAVDLSIELELSEKVTASAGPGGLVFSHLAEPGVAPDDDWPGAPLQTLVVNDEQLLSSS